MSAASARSAALLGQIASVLGVSVEAFSTPARTPMPGIPSDTPPWPLWLDADGRRLAIAFTRLPSEARKALAYSAEALCAGYASDDPRSAEGEP